MDAWTIELVTIGASMDAQCQPCFHHRLKNATKLGLEADYTQDAIKIGTCIGEVDGLHLVEFVEEVMKGLG